MANSGSEENIPYIKGRIYLPEVTVKAVLLGIILAVVFTMSSLYIGLKFARTVAASIPAALLSLMIFKAFKKTNVLENVIVQTIASAGESVASMAAFCVTAILLSGYWQEFKYLDTMLILGLGGILGVFMSIPLRNIMIVKEKMPYPEGIAVAEVLISGESKGHATKLLLQGSFISALIALAQSGFKIGSDFVIYGFRSFGSVFGVSIALSPLSLGAGYIIGISSSAIMLIGAAVANFVVLPYLGLDSGPEIATAEILPLLITLQREYLRYVAVGVMMVGSLWSLLAILPTIKKAVILGIGSTHMVSSPRLRIEKDIPVFWVVSGIFLVSILISIFFYCKLSDTGFSIGYKLIISGLFTLAVIVIGFVMSSVASQLVGILGTTSLPASGLCLATIILFVSIISPVLATGGNSPMMDTTIIGMTLIFTSVIGSVLILSGDNMQDLKTGYLVGSTPWKQQLVLLIGVIVSVVTTPFVLQTMFEAYGIGDMLPRPDMDPTKTLSAPQATLISSVTKGLLIGQLPWPMVNFGIFIGVIIIIIDLILSKTFVSLRLPIMTFAAGFYLPMGISVAFFFGGLLRYLTSKDKNSKDTQENGVMIASGFIAGEAIMGALLSIPFALYKDTNILAIPTGFSSYIQDAIGIIVFVMSAWLFWKFAKSSKNMVLS
ncbi:MAG: oligopeptide transporter, OPT family [Rickettsiales bacterium]|nr:oligopeptide transporter, OPT family [Rickettsiales bacterium]